MTVSTSFTGLGGSHLEPEELAGQRLPVPHGITTLEDDLSRP